MSARAALARGLNAALGLVYPEACQICGEERAAPDAGFVGPRCRSHIRFIQPPFCARCGLPFEGELTTSFECGNCRGEDLHFSSARSAAAARGPVLEAIHRYKYQRALWFEPFLAELLIRRAAPELRRERWDWIVPVPLHPVKQRERSLTRPNAWPSGWRSGRNSGAHGLLRRTLPTRTQTLLTREQRTANVRNAFELRAGCRLRGRRIVLLDDVFTTGATTNTCARRCERRARMKFASGQSPADSEYICGYI